MTHIDVIAHGAPNSFARSVQHDPCVAVGLLRATREYLDALDSRCEINATDDTQYNAWSHRLGAAVEGLRDAVRACNPPTLIEARVAVVESSPTPEPLEPL